MKATSNGVFQGDNPLDFALPLAILQIVIVVTLTRVLAYLFRPLRQPRVIAEIVGGILLGPSALGRNKTYLNTFFPAKSLTVLDTLANMGLLFFLFLVGLELDLASLRRTGKKALSIALVGITLPFVLGIGTSFVLLATVSKGVHGPAFLVFMGVALSITAFPVLARILAELKLLTTDVGRMAMSAAAVNDIAAWILLALAIALSGTGSSPLVSLWVFLCGGVFILACSLVVPRVFRWMARSCPEVEPVKELHVVATLATVLAAGFVTDTIGIHALFGAFVIGVLLPKEGPFAGALVEKVEDLVSGLFLPLYFVSSGLKTDIATISGAQSWGLLVLVTVTACFGKVVGTVGVSMLCKVPIRESLTLGFLMNTKGLVELIVLNIGKDRKVLNDQTFAIMVLMAIFTTFITTPIVMTVYKPAHWRKKTGIDKERSVERKEANKELRILACFYGNRSIPTMINLIETLRGTEKKERLCVYAMHLVELTERSSAIRMVQKASKNGLPFWNKANPSDPNQIIVAFETFQRLSKVSIRPMTAISAMAGMHEDVRNSADRKQADMIILPFHKHQRWDGVLETTSAAWRAVNRRVLDDALCSVSILVDRGLGGPTYVASRDVSSNITLLFFGGHDDCEALALGLRMAEHPGISLTVVHISPARDERSVEEVKEKILKNNLIKFEERMVASGSETVEAVKEFSRCDLFLVGRSPNSAAAKSLSLNSDCPDLGPVGGLLTSADFSTSASVLVIQQYRADADAEAAAAPSSKIDKVIPEIEDLEANM